MRSMLCMVLLAPVLALAGITQPVTVLPSENADLNATPVQPAYAQQPVPPAKAFYVGRVDTIGGTTYDWGTNGPIYRFCANAPGFGLHAGWMYSAGASPWPDRNMRYNYFDYTAGDWNWLDPDYMASGVLAYSERTGFGNLDCDPTSGVAVFVAHGGNPLRPIAARDMAPGAGIFEACNGSPNAEAYQWPYFAMGYGSVIHDACVDNATQDGIWYTKCDPWCTWAVPVAMAGSAPDPMFPTQNIAASRVDQKVAYCWVNSEGTSYNEAYIRYSTDGGAAWTDPVEIPVPPAFGGDTVTSFHITSLFPWYDMSGGFHLVADVNPIVHDTSYIIPAEIWYWNGTTWTEVHRAGCDPMNLQAAVGYNAIYACRPNIGGDAHGNLWVTWEQFDSSNVEPATNLLRADVFMAGSTDNGATWNPAVKVTDMGTGSHRFPSVTQAGVVIGDTTYLPVVYEIDQVAGFVVQGQGPQTNNPIVCQWVPAPSIGIVPGVAEAPSAPSRLELSATPNPFNGRTVISYGVPATGNVSLVLYDASGRPVRTLVNGRRDAGRYSLNLEGSGLAGGVYFYKLVAEGASVTRKLTLAR